MKKYVILSVILILSIFCVVLEFVYEEYLSCFFIDVKEIDVDESPTAQSIMTFNVLCVSGADKDERSWKRRAPLVCDLLQENVPSIICMQENKESQYNFFKRYLKGYDSVATHRDNTFLSECLPIFFRSDMYELERSQTFWLSDTPYVMSKTWDSYYNRIFTVVVLKNRSTGKKFIVCNTHLDDKSSETQEKSVELIYNELIKFDLPAIITGDFNCTPKSAAITLAKKYFTDLGTGFEDENKGTFNHFRDEAPYARIDYIFQLNDAFSVNEYKVIDKKYEGQFVSDHFPVYAEIS